MKCFQYAEIEEQARSSQAYFRGPDKDVRSPDDSWQILGKLGERGWELVSVIWDPNRESRTFYLKRETVR